MQIYVPRSLGSLETNRTCAVFGWGASPNHPRRDSLEIHGPQFCTPGRQAFCTSFASSMHVTCSAMQSSPVVCNSGTIDGFVLNTNGCSLTGDRYRLSYHSIGEYREWIEQVSGALFSTKISIILLVASIVVSILWK